MRVQKLEKELATANSPIEKLEQEGKDIVDSMV